MSLTVHTAVIPAAGLGTRFLPATKAVPKEMLPLVDKPAIQYVVEEAVSAGITNILVVTGRGKSAIEDHFDRSLELEHYLEQAGKFEMAAELREISSLATFHFIRQGQPKGLGHAVGIARRHLGNEPFAVMLGDDIMDPARSVLVDMVEAFEHTHHSVVALKEVPVNEISSYGCAAIVPLEGENARAGDDGRLVRLTGIVEKPTPEEAPSDLAVMGRYVFTPDIFDAIDNVKPGKGGEIQLTDAIALLIEEPGVYGWTFTKGRFDVGNKLDYLRATVELALERDDIGPSFAKWLGEFVHQQDIG